MPRWIQFPKPINWVEEYGKAVWDWLERPPLVECKTEEEFRAGLRLIGQFIAMAPKIREGKYRIDDDGNLSIEE